MTSTSTYRQTEILKTLDAQNTVLLTHANRIEEPEKLVGGLRRPGTFVRVLSFFHNR